ncbi:hypothetical protein P3342_005265 [Pyrenophora teres f. teres]|nr:hypothetical protein P3342_005265 [Pyrenophora teres f. teres]
MILWLFRFPMAIGIALIRCAILIFFIRTLYTKTSPKLRRTGTLARPASQYRRLLLIWLVAHVCIMIATALALGSIVVMASHCRPIKYKFTIPLENPKHCFQMKHSLVAIAATGVALDCLVWYLPHHVVWKLRLRIAHRVAVSAVFAFRLLNVIICVLRVNSLIGMVYQGDRTCGIETTLMWATAQISSGIVVACSLHLRPLFTMILPHGLIHLSSHRSKNTSKTSQSSQRPQTIQVPLIDQRRIGSITVTTDIAVRDGAHLHPHPPEFQDGPVDPWASTFDIEQGPSRRINCLAFFS